MTQPTSPADHALADARERVKLPGIFLVIVGLLNLVVAGLVLVPAVQLVRMSDEELTEVVQDAEEELTRLFPGRRPLGLAEWGKKDRGMRQLRAQVALSAGAGAVMLLFAGLSILGGWRMVQLRSRGLAIAGSALATIPCVSPLGCCWSARRSACGRWSCCSTPTWPRPCRAPRSSRLIASHHDRGRRSERTSWGIAGRVAW